MQAARNSGRGTVGERMLRTQRRRLDPAILNLPVEKMREGYYSDVYFNRAREILEADGYHPRVRMQVFQRNRAVLCGIDEAIAILKLCSGRRADDGSWNDGWDALEVHALYDGDALEPFETAMTIEGDYALFAHLETPYLGVLARRTRIATNARAIVDAANGKEVLFFPARFDHHLVQTGDGYAAYISGALGDRLWGVRLDTSGTLVDRSVIPQMGTFVPTGVNAQLVHNVRNALDAGGFGHVKIVVSGGFDAGRIRRFEDDLVPVDAYAVGSAFFKGAGSFDFTADIVAIDTGEGWRECHKVGRPELPNPRLSPVE